MFIAREAELELLNDLYNSSKFECLILYGRRRVGKTSLLKEFSKNKDTVFFSAQTKNDRLNLSDFSYVVQNHFREEFFGTFENWSKAFSYISSKASEKRITLIIDEFPFIAAENPSIKSTLQHTIDNDWKNKNIFLVLCGSSISFMEKEVMGYSSPLYGRSTAQFELKPFDYIDSSKFFPNYSNTEKLLAYGILGGIPRYLEQFSDSKSIEENISVNIFGNTAFLKEEPQVLLHMELRDPAVYNSILESIANGASKMNDISNKVHEETQKCSKYLNTLRLIKLVDKITPAGDDESSKKSVYKISDNFIRFWFRFVFKNRTYTELLGPDASAKEIMESESINTFMGDAFEKICLEYLIRKGKEGKLPFVPHTIGRWWGNNPDKKKQDDIDILLLNKKRTSAVFCECKFRNMAFDKQEFEDLESASEIFKGTKERYYYIFSKGGFSDWVSAKAKENPNISLISADDLFK